MPRKATSKKTLYGKETKLALENFPISGWTIPSEVIKSLAMIKENAAIVNGSLKEIPKTHAKAIRDAANTVKGGGYSDQFPVDVFQTGSGTSTNMNMNEVIASLASTGKLKVHPNDHVNRGQSSNDVFPTAVQLACTAKIQYSLIPALEHLQYMLDSKAKEFKDVIKTGRTHLMDAVPVRLGDEFASYSQLIAQSIQSLKFAQKKLSVLPLGGTAVGTGINAHKKFAKLVIDRISNKTEIALQEAKNHIAAQSCPTALVATSGALRETSASLHKIANDLRHLASGPTAGLSELQLPALQAGSSIMPGKVNPVLCESVIQVHMQTVGADTTVQAAVSTASQYELNTAYPVAAQALIMSMRLITNVSTVFADRCVMGIQANEEFIAFRTARNPMLITPLAKEIGYDAAAKIVKEAMQKGETILEVAMRETKLSERKLKKVLDPTRMV